MRQLVALKAVVRGVIDGRLTPLDCRLIVCVRALEALAAIAVACTTVPTARRTMAKIRPLAIAARGAAPEARILWAFDASRRWRIGRARCLARALAAEALLEQTDRPHRMVIGISSPASGLLKSHAWIERNGEVLLGGHESAAQYVPLIAWFSPIR